MNRWTWNVMAFVVVFLFLFAGFAQGDSLGKVEAKPDGSGGVQAEAAVDLAALARNGAVKDAAWYAKPLVALKEVGKSAANVVAENPGKTALTVITGYIAVRGLQGKLEDDWDKLRGKSGGGGVEPDPSYDFSGSSIGQVTIQTGTGNTSTQTSEIQSPEPEK